MTSAKMSDSSTKLSLSTSVANDNRWVVAAKMHKDKCLVVDSVGIVQLISKEQSEKQKNAKPGKSRAGKQMQIPIKTGSEIKQIAWNFAGTKAVVLVENKSHTQTLYCVTSANQINKLEINVEASISSNIVFDEDGLFYFGTTKGEVHIYDQKLDPADGAQSLVMQGVQYGRVDQIAPFVAESGKKVAFVQNSVPRRFEIVIFDRSNGTFEFQEKCKTDPKWQAINIVDKSVIVSFD